IGMTREELAENLGTIAKSGTREFLARLEESKKQDVGLIGQFGVGFYSAYLVASHVEVVSRAAGTREAQRGSADGKESVTIEPATREVHGTSIILHLRADEKPFLEGWKIRELVRKYSDYLPHPVELEEKTSESAKAERINQGKALWQRAASEVSEAQAEE